MVLYILVFAAALAVSVLLTRAHIGVAYRYGWLDLPSPRRVHSVPTPRLGGVAMYLAFAAVVAVCGLAGYVSSYTAVGLLAGATALVLVGLADDLWGVGPGPKLLFQLAAALLVVVGYDVSIDAVTLPTVGTINFRYSAAGYALTVFWVLGMINTVNFSDGIDGLAGGLALVFSGLLFVVALRAGQRELALYAAALGGVALGFLRYNFAPARIFMGDSGSMFLGFAMGVLSVAAGAKLAAALLVMGLPVVDVAYSIIRRIRSGVPVQRPDKQHLHHRFLTLGLSQRRTAILFYLLAVGFGSAALIPQRLGRLGALLVLVGVAALLIWWVNRRLADAQRTGTPRRHQT